ncbi:MAG: hypothetical protein GX234_09990 [Clostridiales bacterium]|nr:hypothetical protein [Clostridiales bacterium]
MKRGYGKWKKAVRPAAATVMCAVVMGTVFCADRLAVRAGVGEIDLGGGKTLYYGFSGSGSGTKTPLTHSMPGGDIEDVIARVQSMETPSDGGGIEIVGEITAQPMTPVAAHFPPILQRAKMGEPDLYQNTGWENVAWTASNGVTLYITDEWANIGRQDPHRVGEGRLYYGGGANYIYYANMMYSNRYEPNTPEWWAAKELEYDQDWCSHRVIARSGGFEIKPPQVALVDHFQPEISVDETFKNYRDKMRFYTAYRASGHFNVFPSYDGSLAPSLGVFTLNANEEAVQVTNRVFGEGGFTINLCRPPEAPEKFGYNYRLELWNNPDPLDWNILYNALRRITPDADAVYQEIYKQTYSDNPTFQDYNQWVNIGNETCVAVALDRSDARIMFFIKDRNLHPGADGTELPEHSNAVDVRYQRIVWE